MTRWYAQSIHLVEYIKTFQGRWGTSIIDYQIAALLLLLLLLLILILQGWPVSNFCRRTPIDSVVGSIDSSCRVNLDGTWTLGYIHYWLLIGCCTPPPPLPPPPGLTPFELFQINSDWLTGRLNRFRSLSTSSRCTYAGVRSSLTLDSQLFLHQGWPHPNFCRSTTIELQVGSIDWSRREYQDGVSTLGYLHYLLSICCSTPPLPLSPPPGMTPFELFQINSHWLAGRLNRFVSSSTSRRCIEAGVCLLLTLNSLFFLLLLFILLLFLLLQVSPVLNLWTFADQHWLPRW